MIENFEFEGILEVDPNRGVIYFHDKKTGRSVLRICRLPKDIKNIKDNPRSAIDITLGVGVSITTS